MSLYFVQCNKKCSSFSMSDLSHIKHNLSLTGITGLRYLPLSMLRWWLLILNLHNEILFFLSTI